MSESLHQNPDRVCEPRLQITYDAFTGAGAEKYEMPFVIGVFADLTGMPKVRPALSRWTPVTNEDLPLIESRCRLKARGARWAAERRRRQNAQNTRYFYFSKHASRPQDFLFRYA